MKVKFLLISFIVVSLHSCKSGITNPPSEDFSNLSYVLPSLNVNEKPDLKSVIPHFTKDPSKNASILENPRYIEVGFSFQENIDSIVRANQTALELITSSSLEPEYSSENFKNKLGTYYLDLIRNNPNKVDPPTWLKDMCSEAQTSKVAALFLHSSFQANRRMDKVNPRMVSYSKKFYLIVWNKQGEILALEKAKNISNNLHETITDEAWEKTIFELLKK